MSKGQRRALITAHVDFARRIARKVARRVPRCVDREDLEGAALLGLTEAAWRYDDKRGEPFVAYAAKRVRGAVLDELRRADPLSRAGRRSLRKLSEIERRAAQQGGTPADVAREMGMTEPELAELRSKLDLHPEQAAPTEVTEGTASVEHLCPVDELHARRSREAVADAVRGLPSREAQVLSMCYEKDMTLGAVGEVFGVSESRVCQLRTRALRNLRTQLEWLAAA